MIRYVEERSRGAYWRCFLKLCAFVERIRVDTCSPEVGMSERPGTLLRTVKKMEFAETGITAGLQIMELLIGTFRKLHSGGACLKNTRPKSA